MDQEISVAGASAEVFRFDEFTFDGASRRLLHGDTERHLTPKAQQLLRILLTAWPRALSRADLYDALWPSTFVSATNLSSIVNELRRALDDDGKSPHYIRTVHRFGYAFCGNVSSSLPKAAVTLQCEGARHPMREGRNVVGRAHDSQIVIPASFISRHHAAITVSDGVISIEDLDSKNGTFVDGKRIGRSPVIVTRNSKIEFGVVIASIVNRGISSTAEIRLGA